MPDNAFDAQFWSALSLVHTPGLGPRAWKQLVDHYGSAAEAAAKADRWAADGLVREKIASSHLLGEWRQKAAAEWSSWQQSPSEVLLYGEAGYPKRLEQIADPPLYLYAKGRLELCRTPCIAVVGSRRCTQLGRDIATRISYGLSRSGVAIVSGFAWGIDREAHFAGLRGTGSSLAVLGTGLDTIYPSGNRDLWQKLSESGLLLTEFPVAVRPEPGHFPRRNRIISGLSLGVLVVEAAERSGSLITARLALEQNREVFSVPGPLNMPSFAGCNELIRQGATLVRSAEDILQELSPQLDEPAATEPHQQHAGSRQSTKKPAGNPEPAHDLSPEEQALVEMLTHQTKTHIDTLTQRLGWSSQQVSQTLVLLELKGAVKQLSGMYYALA
jgi:DNA processing protein